MDHGVADFHTRGIAVEQQASGLAFQQRHQRSGQLQVAGFGDQGGGELAVQAVQGLLQLRQVGHFHQHGGRAEDFLLQQFIAVQQQADIGLEQLRPGLVALL
ncbi:hypothetical protein FQZ97_850650 [compost metagenome]